MLVFIYVFKSATTLFLSFFFFLSANVSFVLFVLAYVPMDRLVLNAFSKNSFSILAGSNSYLCF